MNKTHFNTLHQSSQRFLNLSLFLTVFVLVFVNLSAYSNADESQNSSSVAKKPDTLQVQKDASYIFDTTMSPYCPGRTVSACPSSKAMELREDVYGMLELGMDRTAVKNFLLDKYGDEVVGIPKKGSWFGLASWLLPLIFLFAGVYFLSKLFKKEPNLNKSEASNLREKDFNDLLSKAKDEVRRNYSKGKV